MNPDNSRIVRKIFAAGVNAVRGYDAVRSVVKLTHNTLGIAGKKYRLSSFNRIIVLGAGKASFDMAKALDEILGRHINEGVIITKYGYGGLLNHIAVMEASHPLPDREGIRATQRVMSIARDVDRHTLVIMLLSGGASSLLVAPDGISLGDKIKTTSLLLKSGAGIDELNTVRKQLSLVKGGRLAGMFYPAEIVTLIISDVIGNKLEIIGSGPTVQDTSTPQQALEIIDRYHGRDKVPQAVIKRLERKKNVTDNRAVRSKVQNIIIADNRKAVDACKNRALKLGLTPVILTTSLHGEAREAGHVLASIANEMARRKTGNRKKVCLISSGETTVTVAGNGKGGRSQELALAFAMDIAGKQKITLLSAGTDGTDGPTDAAGAIIDNTTTNRIAKIGMDPNTYLLNNDSYTVLDKAGALLKTGATGTNVMDIQLILLP
ncbi:MAG: glycerate kinase [Deltaproteobacteria bacterium]|nr:glycerate kinase [Deltaproteobacteria bacterium]